MLEAEMREVKVVEWRLRRKQECQHYFDAFRCIPRVSQREEMQVFLLHSGRASSNTLSSELSARSLFSRSRNEIFSLHPCPASFQNSQLTWCREC
jgi:hypothetical protein